MQISSEPNVNFFDILSEPNIYELFSSEPRNLQNSNDILFCGGGRVGMTSMAVEAGAWC
jgi:hypothetical protein